MTPGQTTSQLTSQSQTTSQLTSQSQTTSQLTSQSQTTSQLTSQSQTTSQLTSQNLTRPADQPESDHDTADQPRASSRLQLLSQRPLHVSAPQPGLFHVSAPQPEPLHVSAPQPEPVTPRGLKVSPARSLADIQHEGCTVSVCTHSLLPKPTHSAPPVHELLPLSETLSRVGIALCCIWATYTHHGTAPGEGSSRRTSPSGGACLNPLHGGVAQQHTLTWSGSHRRTSRGGGISCRTSRGVGGILL